MAILRIECCATCAKTAFRSSLNAAEPARAIPSLILKKISKALLFSKFKRVDTYIQSGLNLLQLMMFLLVFPFVRYSNCQ